MKEIVVCDRANHKEVSLLCKKYGVSVNIDTFSNTETYDIYPEEVNKNLSRYLEVKIASIHGPYKDLCLGSSDKLIKSATMARFEYTYQISRLLGCPNIILHHGYIPGTSYPSSWVKRAKSFFYEFLYNKNHNINIHIENQFERTPDLLSEVVYTVNDSRLKICLDVGHANCNSKTSVIDWIEQLNDKISFVHLHNNNGLTDQHLDFTNGTINFKEICFALEKHAPNCIWGIETNNLDDTEKSIQWLIDNHYLQGNNK
ncbi:MAG: sugar phosphate isomerase/epimerase [Tissierella sp.]|nr:sugar phosphate isomerase/epimerase [Tissierella sp.]